MTTFRFTSANSIQVDGLGVRAFNTDSAGRDTLIVDYGGSLQASGTLADSIWLGPDGGWKVTINGTVRSTQQDGIWLIDNNPEKSAISIGKTGLVLGQRYGLNISSTADIVNAGAIQGGTAAIEFTDTGTHKVKNTGSIYGAVYSIRDQSAGTDNVTNTGTLTGTVFLNSGDDALNNSGTINGDINMGAGYDTVTNSRSIAGNLDLGIGNNKLTNSGRIDGYVYAGDGTDTVKNSGRIESNVILGDGLNIVTNSGTIVGDIIGGIDTDTVRSSGVIGGYVNLGAGNDSFVGGRKNDLVWDGDGSDIFRLGAGNDVYAATRSDGNDGSDIVHGGAGVDQYYASDATGSVYINLDRVAHDFSPLLPGSGRIEANTARGLDISGLFQDTITGFEQAYGGSAADVIYGNAAANDLVGNGADDILFGYGGNDTLNGGEGNDLLFGGAGRDVLRGGLGTDTFMFAATSDSRPAATARDIIMDFETGDVIDLSHIDANSRTKTVNEGFAFIGNDVAFSGVAGQLRAYATANGQIVEGDVNGDRKADFAIELVDPSHLITLTVGDFLL
jgi:serralysin